MGITAPEGGFACPQANVTSELLDLVVAAHGQELVRTLLDRHRVGLAETSQGVAELLDQWTAEVEPDFDTVWHPAFGDTHAMLVDGGDSAERCATALALRLVERGMPGRWRAALPGRTTLRLGSFVLPARQSVEVASDGSTATVGVDGTTTVSFRQANGRWQAHGDLLALPEVRRGPLHFVLGTPSLLSPASAARLLDADAYHFDPGEDVRVDAPWIAACDAAVSLLEAAADVYLPWVGKVLRDVVALQARPGTFNSGSERFSPGVVCVSNQTFVWPLAEMLVHESTHQYLHIITRLGALDDGTDDRLYYSPFRDKERPLFFIVVAYHAFANVLLFYRTARERGFVPDELQDSPVFARREQTLDEQLAAIEPALLETPALTPLGRALWEPLYEQLRS